MANFTAEKHTVWKIQINLCLVKLVQLSIGNSIIQNCFVHPNGLTVSTEILNLHQRSDDSSNETEN